MTGAPGAPAGAPGGSTPAAGFPLRAALIGIGIHILWGGNPVAVKWGLEMFPPLTSGLVRFTMASLCIALWAHLRGLPLRPPRGDWPALTGLAVLFTVQIALMNQAFAMTGGAVGSILIALNPLFAALCAHFMLRDDRLSGAKVAGLVVAFGGTALVLAPSGDGDGTGPPGGWLQAGNWIMVLSAFLLGLRLIASARVLRRLDEVRVTLWMMLLSLPAYALGAAWLETVQWQALGWRPLAGIAYQGLVIAAFGFMVNSYLMKRYTPSVVVSFNFVSPVAGVVLSAWLLGEQLASTLLAGLALVAAGLVLIARRA